MKFHFLRTICMSENNRFFYCAECIFFISAIAYNSVQLYRVCSTFLQLNFVHSCPKTTNFQCLFSSFYVYDRFCNSTNVTNSRNANQGLVLKHSLVFEKVIPSARVGKYEVVYGSKNRNIFCTGFLRQYQNCGKHKLERVAEYIINVLH